MKLSIVIPIYNENRWLGAFWKRLQEAPIDRCAGIDEVEILFVDDGSTDGTSEEVEKLCAMPFRFASGKSAEVRGLKETVNRGKGYAVRQGIKVSTGDLVLIQDADLEYSPYDYPALLCPFSDHGADAVLGSRFAGHPRRVLYFWHSVLNKGLTLLSNMLNDVNLTDMESGYKVVRGPLLRSLKLTSDRFGIEPELISRLSRARAAMYEVPVRYQGRTYGEGKKIRAADGVAALFHILRFGVWDIEPFQAGLSQTLGALESVSEKIYLPLVRKAFSKVGKSGQRRRILEIGSGIGTITHELFAYGDITATDISEEFVKILKRRYQNSTHFEAWQWDATKPFPKETGKFDVIVASNVLEHIEDDTDALERWRDLLNEGGHLILIVPQYPALYSAIDKAVGHFRRYHKSGLKTALDSANLELTTSFCGNPVGIIGWLLFSVLLKRNELPKKQLSLYALLKPLIRFIESPLERRFGINLVAVARKKREIAKPQSPRLAATGS